MTLDVRHDFPLLERTARAGKSLVYLDSAATSQKPRAVLEAEQAFYARHNAAVSRGAHVLAEEATAAFEEARATFARFIGASSAREVVWTQNATAALNLVAGGMASASAGVGGPADPRFVLGPGDRIVVTETEHHANLIPWQQLAQRTGAEFAWIPVDDLGRMDTHALDEVINAQTKVVAFTHVSNVTGIVTDVAPLVQRARAVGALTVVDGCQSVPHLPVNVQELGVDFLASSGHKMLGPTGIGALWGRAELLDALPPSVFGGSTITKVTMEKTEWLPAPQRFEAGSQPVAQVVALAAAVEYLQNLGMEAVAAHEADLALQMRSGLAEMDKVRLIGPVGNSEGSDVVAIAAFAVEGVHSHDVGQVLDDDGICVRVGHHCNQPLHAKFGLPGSTRASAHVYTTHEDVEAFLNSVERARDFFHARSAV